MYYNTLSKPTTTDISVLAWYKWCELPQSQWKSCLFKAVGHPNKRRVKYKYNIDDSVRISKYKPVFEKVYLPNWTEQIFTISQQVQRSPPVHHIKNYQDVLIEGTFYKVELQKLPKSTDDVTYMVEGISQQHKQLWKDYVLVKWRGYPSSINSWNTDKDIIQL